MLFPFLGLYYKLFEDMINSLMKWISVIATVRCLMLSLIFVGKAVACTSKASQWIAKGTIIKRVTETMFGLFNKRITNWFY